MSKEKTRVGSFLQKAAKAVRFGAVEMGKGAAPVGFILNTIEKFTGKDLATGEVKNVSWEKIIWKAVGLIAVIYLLKQDIIDIEFVKDFIKGLI